MRIDYLVYFLNIAQSKSINISAKQLYISQQSLSWAIRSLEQEVGVPLLERHYFGVELTEAGQIVAAHARRIVKEHYALQKDILPFLEPVAPIGTGQLRIGINYHIINELLYTVVRTFSRQNPGIQLQICDYSVPQLEQAVAAGTIDVALYGEWAGHCSPLPAPLIQEALYQAPLLVCVSRKNPLALKKSVTPVELLPEPLIQYSHQQITSTFFAGYGVPYVLLETSSTELFRQTIQDGTGYGLTNLLDWQEDYSFEEKEQLALLPVEHPDAAICYRLLYQQAAVAAPATAAFLRIVHQRFNLLEEHQ